MDEYGADLLNNLAKVRYITMAFEEEATQWLVALHDDDTVKLRQFNRFMAALRKRFEDPLADRKV